MHEDLARQEVRPARSPSRVTGDITARDGAVHIVRGFAGLVQPGKSDEPVLRGREGSPIACCFQEVIVRRHVIQQRRIEKVAARDRARVVEGHRSARSCGLHDKLRLLVDGTEGPAGAAALQGELTCAATWRGVNDVVWREVQQVSRSRRVHVREEAAEALEAAVVVENPRVIHVRDHHVPKDPAGGFAGADDRRRIVIGAHRGHLVVHVTNEEGVVDGGERARLGRACFVEGVHLHAMMGVLRQHYIHELQSARVAKVRVDGVVAAEQHREVLDVHGAAKELDTVVQVVCHLDVIDQSTIPDTSEGDTVDLVIRRDHAAAVPHAHVLQHAGAV
eukprot:scaffold3068_cov269-Pinguiococcus_pyrenoidosus.AAC.4